MTQRDTYVVLLHSHVGERYSAIGECRCHGTCPGWDCSGIASGDLLEEAGGPFICGNTDTLADWLEANGRTCSREVARATPGAWAIRRINNPFMPGDGHMVVSYGDGRTLEAHGHADGVIVGQFDGNRGFSVFGFPPLAGFDVAPAPVPGPGTPKEAKTMGTTAARRVPHSRVQNKEPWLNRYPFVAAIVQPNEHTTLVGFNGAVIKNWHTGQDGTPYAGMHVLDLGVLKAPIEDIEPVDDDPNMAALPAGHNRMVGLAGDGGTFVIEVSAYYL